VDRAAPAGAGGLIVPDLFLYAFGGFVAFVVLLVVFLVVVRRWRVIRGPDKLRGSSDSGGDLNHHM